MKSLALDIETFSDIDLQKCGVYRYAESPQFEIMLLSYAENDGEVVTIDLASGDPMPPEIIDALLDDDVQKWAHNAQFERVCLSQWLRRNVYLDPASWRCSMVWAATLGLPLSLAQVGAVLKLDEQKMSEGKSLIAYFSKPCAPTKSNGMRTRNLPQHDPEKWELYKSDRKSTRLNSSH
jgi:DNA polymerase